MFATFVQRLFTGQIKTRHPVYLFLLAIAGIGLLLPLAFAISETFLGNPMSLGDWIVLALTGLIGLAALVNLIKNLVMLRK